MAFARAGEGGRARARVEADDQAIAPALLRVAPRVAPRVAVAAGIAAAAVGGLALLARATTARVERQVPADGRIVALAGGPLHYRERGEGPPIVMIHGLGGQMRNFSYALLDRLAADHRVILVDRPGSGYSAPLAAAGLAAQGAQVAALIQRLGLDRPLVVGHSLGGAVALALALDHPRAVGGLALIAPLTLPQDEVPPAFRGLAVRSPAVRAAVSWTVATPLALLMGERGLRAAFAPEPVPADFAVRGGGALIARPGNYRAASADLVAAGNDMAGLASRYPDLRVPTAILFGRDDRILDPDLHGRGFTQAVPGSEVTLIEGGHMIPVTRPDETAAWIAARSRLVERSVAA